MSTLYVDYDGTLVDDSVDQLFINMAMDMGKEHALDWYAHSEVWDVMLKLNMPIVHELVARKAKGDRIVLFTNRFPHQIDNIKRNMGTYWNMFDGYIFGQGNKHIVTIVGELWDNDPKYAKCCSMFRLIPTFKG